MEFVEYKNEYLVVLDSDGLRKRFKPDDLGCYVIYVNRTDRGLAKET